MRPGVLEVNAKRVLLVNVFNKLDLPALDLPHMAISDKLSVGKQFKSFTVIKNSACLKLYFLSIYSDPLSYGLDSELVKNEPIAMPITGFEYCKFKLGIATHVFEIQEYIVGGIPPYPALM